MSVDNLTNRMNNITFEEYDEPKYEAKFLLDNSLDSNNSRFVAKVQLSFYQIWSMFSELPVIYKSGKCKYEWKFRHVKTGAVFSIYDWNNKNRLLQKKTWYIGCNINDDKIVSEFLAVLCDAIECYNKYYKKEIENKTFKSDNPIVQNALDSFRKSISEQKDILLTI